MNDNYSQRQQYDLLKGQLDLERSSFIPHWRDLGDFILPRRPRFTLSDVNSGERRSQSIIDSTATLAVRTLRSGMMSGVTSPARQWFRLSTPDPDLAEFGKVKDWLYTVSQRMSNMFLKSNLYNSLPSVYGDMGTFATGAMFIEEEPMGSVMRTYPIPIGSYWIANNDKLRVDTWMRDFQMTVDQIVRKFGTKNDGTRDIDWTNISTQVRSLWDNGQYQTWIDVHHVVHPNMNYNPRSPLSKDKKFLSVHYELGTRADGAFSATDTKNMLSEKGYSFFPVLCPRWETTGEDSWGTNCPGMEALGDVRQLQLGERRGFQAIEKMINPAMTAPASMRNSKTTLLPGDVTFVDDNRGGGFKPAHEVQFRIDHLENKQEQVRHRISRAFFEDLFLMLAQSDRRDITAREIDERHEEKLLALGPVLEQLNQDLLDPLIDNGFNFMGQQNLLPPPPDELRGMDLKIEYVSIMAQAQKMVGIGTIERFMSFAGQVAGFAPQAMDKVDVDQTLDVYSDILSVPPGVVRSDEKVAAIRKAKADAAQAQAKSEQLPQLADAAKSLSGASMEGDNALTRLVDQSKAGAIA